MQLTRSIFVCVGLVLATAVASPAPAAKTTQASRPSGGEIELRLVAADKQPVFGWFREVRPKDSKESDASWRAGANVVVLLHMYGSRHEAWESILPEFAARGISTLAIDMRGHGVNLKGPEGEDLVKLTENGVPRHFLGMYQDAFAVIDWLEQRGFQSERIGLLGASVGSAVSIDAARRRTGLGPVGALTPGLNYLGVPTVEHLKQWGERQLLIVTSKEEALGGPAPLRDSLLAAFEERSKRDPQAKDGLTYWELEETSIHGTRMFGRVPGIEGRVADWYAERFGEASEPGSDSRPSSQPAGR